MVTEIRLYVEGGGDYKETKARLRKGFQGFFDEIVKAARSKRVRWNITVCGGRSSTYKGFLNALTNHPEAFSILLVDSEGPVATGPWEHLYSHESWDRRAADDKQCHLMVQTMEAWLIADSQALKDFYGNGFHAKNIPSRSDVELIDKADLLRSLERATRNTTKGAYHKTRHAPKILGKLNVSLVREKAAHCDRLFCVLASLVE
jgi:hypothetical protein